MEVYQNKTSIEVMVDIKQESPSRSSESKNTVVISSGVTLIMKLIDRLNGNYLAYCISKYYAF